MATKDDHLQGEFVLETIKDGKFAHDIIRSTESDDHVLRLPSYFDGPIIDVHEKLLPQLPRYEEVKGIDDIEDVEEEEDDDDDDDEGNIIVDFIRQNIISIITILLFFYLMFYTIQYSLSKIDPNLSADDRIARPWPPRPKYPPLDFVETFPALNVTLSSPECRAAWGALTAVPCSGDIWSHSWDDGHPLLSPPLITRTLSEICEEKCIKALQKAQVSLSSVCAGQAAFMVDGFRRWRIDKKLLESDPSQVLSTLVNRTAYMCRKSPIKDAERGFCKVDMASRWGIMDRFEESGIADLDLFLSATKIESTELANLVQGIDKSTHVYNSVKEVRRFGPRRNSTTCSWCTLNWFESKLAMWDPKMFEYGGPERLSQFLRMWEKAGRRCEGKKFNEIFNSAVQSYKDAGLLSDDWEDEQSGRGDYLVRHGPSSGDYPLSFALQVVKKVKKYRQAHGSAPLLPILHPEGDRRESLYDEFISCIEAFVFEAEELPCYPFIDWDQMKELIFSSPDTARAACSEACFSAIHILREKIWEACPSTKHLGMRVYDEILPQSPQWHTDFSLATYFGNQTGEGSISGYRYGCISAKGPDNIPCAAVFAKWGRANWLIRPSWARIVDVIKIARHQLQILPKLPDNLREWKEPIDRQLTNEENEISRQLAAWKWSMGEGVCSNCMWRTFVPYNITAESIQSITLTIEHGEDVAMEWIKTMHLLTKECAARRIDFPEQEATDFDAAWIEVHSQEMFDQALGEERETPEWLIDPE